MALRPELGRLRGLPCGRLSTRQVYVALMQGVGCRRQPEEPAFAIDGGCGHELLPVQTTTEQTRQLTRYGVDTRRGSQGAKPGLE